MVTGKQPFCEIPGIPYGQLFTERHDDPIGRTPQQIMGRVKRAIITNHVEDVIGQLIRHANRIEIAAHRDDQIITPCQQGNAFDRGDEQRGCLAPCDHGVGVPVGVACQLKFHGLAKGCIFHVSGHDLD